MRDRLRRPSRRGLAAVAVIAGTLGLVVAGAAWLAARPVPAPSGFTYAGAWAMPELMAHAGAGEVVAISAAESPTGSGPELVALTSDGQHIAVEAGMPVADAVDVVRVSGYGRLLTTEAATLSGARGGTTTPLAALPWLVAVGLLVVAGVLVMRLVGRRGGGGRRFGAVSRSRDDKFAAAFPGVRLADVAGVEEAKTELIETIEFLKDPARFAAVGARPVRGVMLFGPPGTGKTMLAKAVAAEAGVPFIAVSGSDFVEKFVGVGARRVRDLFAAARKEGRAVVFLDEVDALAKRRGGENSHDEREGTLNALLVEMDGFGPNDNVVVLAATNRLDVLDPAVLRPGRFTRKVNVPLPDKDGRLAILAVHAAGKPLGPDVDLPAVARKTYGFSGAQLADLLNEAAILTARRGASVIEPADVQAGWLKVAVGTSRVRSMDARERSIIAAHEAGHAVAGYLSGEKRRIEEISLYAHGDALGVTVSSQEDNDLPSETDLQSRLVALMGGRAAENLLFHDVTGGASNDFEKATNIASTMVTRLGMGRDPRDSTQGATGRGILSAIVTTDRVRPSSEVAAAQDRAVRSILDAAYRRASDLLVEHRDLLARVAGYLYEQERMSGDEFLRVVSGELAPADPRGWRSAGSNPREWEEIPGLFSREERRASAGSAIVEDPPRTRRRPGLRNRVRRSLPRPVHLALRELAAFLAGDAPTGTA